MTRPAFRHLSYDTPPTQKQALLDLAEYAPDEPLDRQGEGLADRLEARLCDLLGKEAALFMPSGKAAQNAALKIWCQRQGHDRVAIHPRAHPEEWEAKALSEIFGLRSTALGAYDRQSSLEDLRSIRDPIGVATVELALRPLGCIALPYEDLKAMSAYARQNGIPFHGDAARLWDLQPYYGETHAAISSHFDTLYVSLYKILRGFAGGVLLGPADFIAELKVWQKRMGQTPYRQFPYVLAAMRGLDTHLPKIPSYYRKACEIAGALKDLDGIFRVNPLPPQTPSFQVIFEARAETMAKARDRLQDQIGLRLFDHVFLSPYVGLSMMEVHVGQSALAMSLDEIVGAFRAFIQALRGPCA